MRKSNASRGLGFTHESERLHGRMAMLGFGVAIAIETLTGQGVLHFLNLL